MHYEKFPDGSVKCIENEIPFELPQGWEWTRIASVCLVNPRNTLEDSLQVSFVPMSLIKEGFSNSYTTEVREWKKVKKGFTHFAESDIAIAKITPCFENRKSVIFSNLKNKYGAGTTELHILRAIDILPEYILWIIKTEDFISKGVQAFTGAVGQQRVGKNFISNYFIPIPPLVEQKRIVDKINELFYLISLIETDKITLQATIQLTKSKILDLAIRGKLVPQDPNDEPASVLLERIRAGKEELIKQGRIKRDKKESVIFRGEDNSYYEKIGNTVTCIDEELPFELPKSWEWCNLSMIGQTNIGLTYSPADIVPDNGTIVFRSSNIINNQLDYSDLVRVNKSIRDNQYLANNDILICARNGSKALVGKCALIKNLSERASFGAFMAIYRTTFYTYVFYFLQTSIFRDTFHDSNSTAINQLTQAMIKKTRIPLPPFEEQLRIVEYLNKYFDLLNYIEKSLN